MSATYLLDTGWVVRHFRGARTYTEAIQRIGPANVAISIITVAELYEGVNRATNPDLAEQALITFLSDKIILPITGPVCQLFGAQRARLRQRNELIGDFDLLIAATCLHYNLTLLTTNRRHFRRISRLRIIFQPKEV